MSDAGRKALERWSRANAVVALAACLVSLKLGTSTPCAWAAAVSFGVLIAMNAQHWTDSGRFGSANAVTLLRFLLLVSGSVSFGTALHWQFGALLILVFVLDGVDGWLARRQGLSSQFGAHFDMETDSLLVLLSGIELWLRGITGAWILIPGCLRYVYVLCLALIPPHGPETPRSLLGRFAFSALAIGLISAFIAPKPWGSVVAAIGSVAVTLSFVRSFYWAYFKRPAS